MRSVKAAVNSNNNNSRVPFFYLFLHARKLHPPLFLFLTGKGVYRDESVLFFFERQLEMTERERKFKKNFFLRRKDEGVSLFLV